MNKKRELTESEIEELDITLGNNEIVWCEIEYKEDEEYKPYKVSEVLKLPMSSKEDNLKNKSCDYNTLAIMTLYSNANLTNDDEYQRYVYLNKIYKNQKEIEKLSKNKINTIAKNIRKLSKLENKLVEARNTENGIVYIINYEDENQRKYVTIEEEILKLLIECCSSNVIKTYILLKYLCTSNPKIIDRKYIAREIGLSDKSDNNLKTIGRILRVLMKLNLIEREEIKKVEVLENGNQKFKIKYKYKIVDYITWKERFYK